MHSISCRRVVLREIALPLREPFASAAGIEKHRRLVIVEAHGEGTVGYGECQPLSAPYYTEETPETVWYVLERFLIPRVLGRTYPHPEQFASDLRPIRRHPMAKAGLEGAWWDLYARVTGQPLWKTLGGVRRRVESGVVVGIVRDLRALLRQVAAFLEEGYRRIKLKIEPGWDLEPLQAVRREFGDIPLAADANGTYTLDDLPALLRLDELALDMLEQPLSPDAGLLDHATLQRRLRTPICLDESIETLHDVRLALHLGSCRMINLKVARVGGLTSARAIHDLCRSEGVPVWVGGMIESGIGKLHSLALASLPGCTLPGDLPASRRHWLEDVIEPPIAVDRDGCITIPADTGLGATVDVRRLERYTLRTAEFTADR